MKGRSARRVLAWLGLAIAAGVVGVVIAAVRPGKPVIYEHAGTEAPAAERDLQPVP